MPAYLHDCEQCLYIGTTSFPVLPASVEMACPHTILDMYVCPKILPTLVLRYGAEGPDYTSYPLSSDHLRKLMAALL